ncbi:MAG: VWA domain-containing protein, partial [Acidisphaera sp.]|nr:VWA domain-containing protein [Acidisphaera sp.]
STAEVLRTYGADYKAIFVGDATMSPYEILQPGASVEHWNDEAGSVWLDRLVRHFRSTAWLNPAPQRAWTHMPSIQLIRQAVEGRMFPLTLAGIEEMTKEISK